MSDSVNDRPDFRIEIHQNKYLTAGDTQVHAIVMVEAEGGPAAMTARAPGAAEVIIVDTSASMAGERLVAAKRAAKAAVDALRDGVDFAIVSGSDRAGMVYPRDLLMAPATDRNRAWAKSAIARLTASGGTRLGRWLELANALFADRGGGIRHAILLTDGKDQHETADELDTVLASCAGRFVCDCRGVGTDWEVGTLRRVADALLGGVDLVADPRDLAADFTAMIEAAMGKAVADVALRIWTPHGATPRFVKQVLPTMLDLTDRRTEIPTPDAGSGSPVAGPTVGDYPTGIWGKERRDYHVCVTVPAGQPDEEILAAKVSLLLPAAGTAADVVLAEGRVLAEWTDDEQPSTGLHPWVEHYSKQGRLADSIRLGLDAYQQGDLDAASKQLGRAVDLAKQTGNTETSVRLDDIVDVDPATGVTYVKQGVDKATEMALDVKSTGAVPLAGGSSAARTSPTTPQPRVARLGRRPPTPPNYAPPVPGPGGAPGGADPRQSGVVPLPQSPPPQTSTTRPSGRWLTADCPLRASVGDVVHLLVRIVADNSAEAHSQRVAVRPFDVPAQGAKVTIIVDLGAGLIAYDVLGQELLVPAAGDSDPLLFRLRVAQAGLQRIRVLAWAGGTFLGELTVEMSAEVSAPVVRRIHRAAPLGALRATPGEVTLQIRRSPDGQYMFQMLSDRTIYDPITESLAGEPAGAVERTIAALQDQASTRSRKSSASLWLREAGVNLWEQMVPQIIKEQFWELREDITAFSIATDQDIIPWELLYPITRAEDAGFLVEQFPVVRRVYGQQRAATISLDPAVFVIPDGSPTEAYREVEGINWNLRTVLQTGNGELLRAMDELMTCVNSGQVGLLHFACHNSFDIAATGSSIAMPDGGFAPMMLSSAVATQVLSSRHPLVFVNACRSAGAIYEYTRLMSWASQFMSAGAGAFVGTLWAVPSPAAYAFSEAFYDAFLLQRQPLGEAVRTARIAIRDSADPTWLAYTVYGDPAATVADGILGW